MENLARQPLDWAEGEYGEGGIFTSQEGILPLILGIHRVNPEAATQILDILERNQHLRDSNEGTDG